MLARFAYQSLALSFLGRTIALNLDTNSPDSIKSVAKTLASDIVSKYNVSIEQNLVPGLFNDPYFWWEAGAVFGGLIEYAHLTGDTQHNELVAAGMVHQLGEYDAFMPLNQSGTLGNDDQSYWGLAAMTAAEAGLAAPSAVSGDWAEIAANVFNTQIVRWNTETCGGGLKWQIFPLNNGYNYKNSISTGNLFLLSARLAHFTGNTTYSEWAEKALKWTQDIGLVDEDYAVYDGTTDTGNCSTVNSVQWSANSAIYAEGAALMYNLTNGDDKWKTAVTGFVDSGTVFQNDDSVLVERACESRGKCNTDQKAFKGIAIRSWARTARVAPFTSDAITKMIKASAAAAAKSCEIDDDEVECSFQWANGTDVAVRGFGEMHNALQAVSALLWPQAKALASQDSTSTGASPGGNPSGNGTGDGTNPGASQNTDAPGAASVITASSALVFSATIVAMLCL